MRHYVWIDADGAQCFGSTESAALPKGSRQVPRLPGAFERWDFKRKAFVVDVAARADDEAGGEHIAWARAQKAIEARLIAGGIVSPAMLLVREAELRGISAEELAATVLAKVAEADAVEIARQRASLT